MQADLSRLSDSALVILERHGVEVRDRALADFVTTERYELAQIALDVERYTAQFRDELAARLSVELDALEGLE